MNIFSKQKEKKELVLVLDVRSSSVGGAIFGTEPSGVPKIIFSVREPVSFKKNIEIDELLTLTLKALEVVVGKIYKVGLGAPAHVFCVLSSPWYVSQTRTINLKKNTPFLFTNKLADSLIQKEIDLFEEECSAKNIGKDNSFRTIELKNIKTILNGYETKHPIDQKVKELEMVIFVSISGEQVLKKIEDAIGQHFHLMPVKFSSFMLASFTAVRDLYSEQENFLLIDISGEVTDISMVKKDVLHESTSFPLGHNFFIRKVAASLHSTLDEAKSLISLYQDGHAAERLVKKIEPIINNLKTEWLQKFQESLANLSNDISIPSAIYLTANKSMAEFFSQLIKTEQFNQYTLTESKFKIIFLDNQSLHGLATFEEEVVRDTLLIIDSVYINRFLVKT